MARGSALQRLDVLDRSRRRIDRFGIERRVQHLGRLRDQLQLGRLILGHETVQRHHAQRLPAPSRACGLDLARRLRELRQHVDGVGAGVRVLAQIEEGRDRFHLRIAQVDRVEVELQEIEQRQAGDRDQQRADDDHDAMLFQEPVDRRQEAHSRPAPFAGRIEQLEQRRQHRDAGRNAIIMPAPAILPSSDMPL